jgi:hypothetical protein
MLMALIVFVVVAGSIIGGYYAVTMLPGVLAARRLERRLQDVSADPVVADPKSGDDSVLQHKLEGPLPGMDRLVSGTGLGKRMARLIEQSGVRTTPSAIGLMCLICAAICGVITFMFVPQRFAPLAACVSARSCRSPFSSTGGRCG